MTESQWRFLSAIAARVPTERIVELRLFPAIRQGGMESGAAVVAVEELVDLPPGESAPDGTPSGAAEGSALAAGDGGPTDAEIAVDLGPLFEPAVPGESASGDGPAAAGGTEDTSEKAISARSSGVASDGGASASGRATRGTSDSEVPIGADEFGTWSDMALSSDQTGDVEMNSESLATESELSARPQVKRYSVLAARYRLTLKGPERGAWDFELTHEADAPLDTVERVARGVARRSGDEGQPEHLTASDIRATLAQPWWSGSQ